MNERLTSTQFFTGFFAALALRHVAALSIRIDRFDLTISELFGPFRQAASARGVDLRFRIVADRVHGDSPTVRSAIANAAQRDIISLDNPTYQDVRITLTEDEANEFVDSLPGGRDLYLNFADRFIDAYSERVA